MKIVMNNKQLGDLIKKYQKETYDFEGDLKIITEEDIDRNYYDIYVTAIMTGKLKIGDQEYTITQEMGEVEIKDIIKKYVEQTGYRVNKIDFIGLVPNKQYDYEKDNIVYDNVEVELLPKVKKIGGM
jgi:hypothetical protein